MKTIKEKTFMITGDSGCGKTTLLKVMNCDVNPELPTVYFKFLSDTKKPKKRKKAKKKVMVSMWDTPAKGWNETREAIIPHLDAVIIVFALDDRQSLKNAREKWYPEVRELCKKKIPIVLVGNKTDIRDDPAKCDQVITYDEGLKVAEKIKAYAYVECSALHEEGTLSVFTFAINSVIKKSKCYIL